MQRNYLNVNGTDIYNICVMNKVPYNDPTSLMGMRAESHIGKNSRSNDQRPGHLFPRSHKPDVTEVHLPAEIGSDIEYHESIQHVARRLKISSSIARDAQHFFNAFMGEDDPAIVIVFHEKALHHFVSCLNYYLPLQPGPALPNFAGRVAITDRDFIDQMYSDLRAIMGHSQQLGQYCLVFSGNIAEFAIAHGYLSDFIKDNYSQYFVQCGGVGYTLCMVGVSQTKCLTTFSPLPIHTTQGEIIPFENF